MVMAAEAGLAGSAMGVAMRMTEGDAGICGGAVYVTAAPEALELAESKPHAPGAQFERDQETPLFCVSLATVAVKLWVWPGWTVMDAGATDTEMAGWGGGVTTGGGSLPGADEEWALAFEGNEAQPPARKAANRQNTARAIAASRTARTPGSGFKVEILRCLPWAGESS
jgi:hypothetical protein